MSVKVLVDRRERYNRMRASLRQGAKNVYVGITEEVGEQMHPNGKATILEIACWNEFGTKWAPDRSFLVSWFDQNVEASYAKLNEVSQGVIDGTKTLTQALQELGRWAAKMIKKNMRRGIPPPNSPLTVRRKGFDKGTIESGTLAKMIRHIVKAAGERV